MGTFALYLSSVQARREWESNRKSSIAYGEKNMPRVTCNFYNMFKLAWHYNWWSQVFQEVSEIIIFVKFYLKNNFLMENEIWKTYF